MKPFASLLVCLALSSAIPATSQAGHPQPANPSTIQLESTKKIRKGVDSWPLISNASTPEQQRINATLTKLNATIVQSLRDCDANYRDSAKQNGTPLTGQNAVQNDWQRTIKVTMTGPRFLSLVATDEADCGGAHPDSDTLAMVFDLTTGRPADWTKLIAAAANATPYSDSIIDGTKVGALMVPALRPITIAGADAECKDVFDDKQSYQLWPDAASGHLIAEPFDLPHAVAACANDLSLTIDQARKLGFDDSLLAAIQQAHTASGKPGTP